MRKIYLLTFLLISLLLAPAFGCSLAQTQSSQPVVVGSKIDTEGALLSQMIILMLKANNIPVTDKSQTGTTSIVRQAILSGAIDMYPEYTGNGAFFFNEQGSPVWDNAQQGYQEVKKLDKEKNNIIWLTPAPANNTWAIAVTENLSRQKNLKSLTDFAGYVNSGAYVKLIGSEEFITSPVALPAFEKVYGFTLSSDQLISIASGNTAETEKAAYQGTNGVNACMAYGTDGDLSAFGLVVLTDPKGAQPVYEPTPIIRGVVLDRYPQIAAILAPVFESLTLTTLQSLNAKIAVDGQNPTDVAQNYLISKGFLK